MIISEIKNLREELYSLVELQKSVLNKDLTNRTSNNNTDILDESNYKKEFEEKKSNDTEEVKISHDHNSVCDKSEPVKDEIKHNSNNELNEINSNRNLFNNEQNENLPNIEQFFVFNNKFSLVDSDKNLWHLKKCSKFDEFTKNNKNIYNSREDNLFAFLEFYQKSKETKTEKLFKNTDDIPEVPEANIHEDENVYKIKNKHTLSDNSYTISSDSD
jgi:hypothetical protein